MREVDRIMVEDLGIELRQMMENAGRALAEQTRTLLLAGDARGRRVVVAAGAGGNGGGGIAAGRRLSIWGAEVSIVLGRAETEMQETPAQQLAIAKRLGLTLPTGEAAAAQIRSADAVIDALIGYGLRERPEGRIAELIDSINGAGVPVIALDVPSGLDSDRGTAPGAAVRATTTLTLALPKRGLLAPGAGAYVGSLFLADISVPALVYQRLGLNVEHIFARSDIVAVTAI
jgi:NAD(P)H-hydrate epimerase